MQRTIKSGIRVDRRGLRSCALAAWMLCGGALFAAEARAQERHAIHQPAQPLADALRAVARQTGASLIFDPEAVRGLGAAPISGQYTATEAIERLLQGSALVLVVQPDGALVVRPAPARGGAPAGTETPSPQKIEVTGSRLRRIDRDAALPLNVYGRDEIEKSGQPSLGRFLSGLNEVSMGQGEGSYSAATQGQGNVQLRGLPLGSTLVLVNGRRLQAVGSSSANFFNLNLIPLTAVERVEVVPVGSSAVYGGDALAGVVNVILKPSIDGRTLDLRLATGEGFGDGSVSLAAGDSGERGTWMLIGTYARSTPLDMGERSFFGNVDFRRFGGPDVRARNCTPGTVTSTTGRNLPGLSSTLAGIPEAASGTKLTVADFAATAGQANLCNNLSANGATALVHGSESLSVHAAGHRQWSGGLELFGDLTHVRDRVRADGRGLNLNNLTVPASNPHNPFGEAVRVTARLGFENGREAYTRGTDFTRVLAGLRGPMGLIADWDFEVSAAVSHDTGHRLLVNNTVDTAARTAALATADPALSLNPFTTGRAASEAVLNGIWSDNDRENRGRRDSLAAFARGPLLELPAGPVDAIVGAEVGRDSYLTILPGVHHDDRRQTRAAYAELRVPLWRGTADGGRQWPGAALTLAGRSDHYSDFGSSATWQAGLELRPLRSLLVRASAATSFKPPTLLQIGVDEQVFPIENSGVTDPLRGNAPVTGADWVRTTNHDLQPETGRAFALGVVWEPDAARGTRLGATAWRIRIDDLIGILPPQAVVDNADLFPGWVTREPSVGGMPGRITQLIWAESNFGFVETRGIDLEASQAWRTALGRFTLGASATRTSAYSVAIVPGAPGEDRVGKRFSDYWAPAWKGRLALTWDRGTWSAGIASRYVSSYEDSGTSTLKLGGRWVHDLSGRVDLKPLGLGLGPARAATLSLSIVNAGNVLPEFANGAPYYDRTQGDWRGRYASLRLSVDW